jgi:site-specific recombinase
MSSCRQAKALFAGLNVATPIAFASTLHIARETQQQAMAADKIRHQLERHLWKAVWAICLQTQSRGVGLRRGVA